MTVLYYSTNGARWHRDSANFLTGDDICFWHHPNLFEGVYCTKFSLDPHKTPILLYLSTSLRLPILDYFVFCVHSVHEVALTSLPTHLFSTPPIVPTRQHGTQWSNPQ